MMIAAIAMAAIIAKWEPLNPEQHGVPTESAVERSREDSRASEETTEAVDSSSLVLEPVNTTAVKDNDTANSVSSQSSVTPVSLRAIVKDSSMTLAEARRFVAGLEHSTLTEFFSRYTHMDEQWLTQNGLSRHAQKRILAQWLSTEPVRPEGASEQVAMMSRYNSKSSSMYMAQSIFNDDLGSMYLHYSVPNYYQPDSVVIKWYDTNERSLVHMDWHPVSDNPQLMQEAWLRPDRRWEPGSYRVEIFAANSSLDVIAATKYQVTE